MNNKILLFIFSLFAASLYAGSDTCYSVQFQSSYSPLSVGNFPVGSKVIKIGRVYTVRYGCFDKFKNAKQELSKFKGRYRDAMITSTYKWRFDNKANEQKNKPKIKDSQVVEKKPTSMYMGIVKQNNIKSNNPSLDDSQMKPMTKSVYKVDTLISMMLGDHPTIQAQKFAIQGANAQVKGAKWGYFPSLSLRANQEFNRKKAWDETISLSQPLWTGGKLDAEYDMAVANRDKSKSALLESEYTLVSTLLTTLEKYIKNKANTKALLKGKKRLITLKEMLSKRVSAGVSSESDQALLDTRLYQIETDIQQASASMQTALAQIVLYTGHDFDKSLEIKEGIEHKFDSLNSLISLMEQTHPTLRKYDALIANAKAEKSKAKAVLFPTVSVNLQQGFNANKSYNSTNNTNGTRVYLSVDASLGSGFSTLSKIEQVEAKEMQLIQEKFSVKQKLNNRMILTYNDYISSLKRIQSQSGSIASSQKVFESYKRLFLRGKRAWLDLVNASRELRQNQIVLNNTKATRLISAYTLVLLSGKSSLQTGFK